MSLSFKSLIVSAIVAKAFLLYALETNQAQQTDAPESLTPDDKPGSMNADGFGSSLLDDLLKKPAPASTEQPPSSSVPENQSAGSLNSALSLNSDGIGRVIAEMQNAAHRLQQGNALSAGTLGEAVIAQDRAIEELDKLLGQQSSQRRKVLSQSQTSDMSNTASNKGSNQQQSDTEPNEKPSNDAGSSSTDQSSSADRSNDKDQTGPHQSNAKPTGKNQGNDSSNDDPNAEEVSGMPSKETVVDLLQQVETQGGANWGKLPTRLREQMSNPGAMQFPRGYETQVREYYKRLNDAILQKQ